MKGFFVLAIFVFIGRVLVVGWDELAEYDPVVRPDLLFASVVALCLHYFVSAILWHLITVANKVAIPAPLALSAWFYSILGKYIPGKVFLFFNRLYSYRRAQVPTAQVTICFAIEFFLHLSCSLLIICAYFLVFSDSEFFNIPAVSFLFIIATAAVAVHPRLLERILNFVLNLLRREAISVVVDYRTLIMLFSLCLANTLLLGLAFFLLVSALFPVAGRQYFFLTACFLLSSWAGILSVITPGGLGVRDGVLLLSLQVLMPPPAAAAVALTARMWTTACELGSAGISWLVRAAYSRRKTHGS